MRWIRWTTLVLLAGIAGSGAVFAGDEPPAGPGAAPSGAPDALAEGMAALRIRMEAKMKEADLLMKAGRTDEALAALRSIDSMYAEGVKDLQALTGRPAAGVGPALRVRLREQPPSQPRVVHRPPEEVTQSATVAVENALRWLAAHQSPVGGWEAAGFGLWCDGKPNLGQKPDGAGKALYDPGVTGLALCAFLGAGYANRGEHPFAKTVAKGLSYLKNAQDPEGCFGPRTTQHYIYNHAIASLAMVEAYGLTQSPLLKDSAQAALNFIAIARNPYFVWRYGVKPGDNDTSVTGWMMMALKSAKLVNDQAIRRGEAAPLTIDEEAFTGIRAWIDKMTDPDYGRVGYIQRGTGPARPQELVDRFPAEKSESMTAVGVLARIYLGEDPRTSDLVKKGADLMLRLAPQWDPNDGSIDMYYWYYGTQAMFQVGGDYWRRWHDALTTAILPNQHLDGDYCGFKGSWDPIDPWGSDGGRVYSTAIMALCSEIYLRYAQSVVPR